VHPVDRLRRPTQRVHLVGRLAKPKVTQHRGQRLPGTGHGIAQAKDVQSRHRVGEGDGVGLAADRVAYQTRGQGEGVVVLLMIGDLHDAAGAARLRSRVLKARHDEHRLAACGNDQAGQPLERDRGITDEVAQVRPRRDEDRVDPVACGGVARRVQPRPKDQRIRGMCHVCRLAFAHALRACP
jgi:hypothetical protein